MTAAGDNSDPAPDILPVAVRVFGFPDGKKLDPPEPKDYGRGPSEWQLILHPVTTDDPAQRCRYVGYQLRKGDHLREIGLAYDPEIVTADELNILRSYAASKRVKLLTLSEFRYGILLRVGYQWQATTIGYDLPYTLSRLSTRYGLTRGKMRPGFKFEMMPDGRSGPEVRIKHVSRRFSLMTWSRSGQKLPRGMRKRLVDGPRRRPAFVDVLTLGSALLNQVFPLRDLALCLDKPQQRSATDEYGKKITSASLDNILRDVETIWECFVELRRRFLLHGLTLPIDKVFSGASIGKAYLRDMGVRPLLAVQPDFPVEHFGRIMETYYGGRTEARIRRKIMQVVYCDFTSEYPTVCTLMGLWQFVIANGLERRDATAKARAILASTGLAELQRQQTWRDLNILVQVEPNGDALPVRARYGRDIQRTTGTNHLRSSPRPLWFTLADCIASKLKTGKAPEVVQAIAFTPRGKQSGLRPLRIAGRPDFQVDPNTDDFYRRLIELRSETAGEEKDAIKTIAVATSYGILVQLNIQELEEPVPVRCYPGSGPQFIKDMDRIEEPGDFFNPFLASLITGGGRLMLAIAERLVADAGLEWAFCDTDSIAIARPDSMPEPEFYEKANAVRRWFDVLNPYRANLELLKLEDENFPISGDRSSGFHRLYCYVLSSKRYALFNMDEVTREITIRKASAHALGHLIPPYDDASAPPHIPQSKIPSAEIGLLRWQHDFWYCILRAAVDSASRPNIHRLPNFNMRAVVRHGANTPKQLDAFERYNQGKPISEQVRPFNSVLMFLAHRQLTEDDWLPEDEAKSRENYLCLPQVVAPYRPNPADAARDCVDCDTGEPVRLDRLQTYADALATYHLHAESKFGNGMRLQSGTTGLRHVQASAIEYIGKEANRWEEQAILGYDPEQEIDFGMSPIEAAAILRDVVAAAEVHGQRAVAAAADISLQQLSAIILRNATPTQRTLKKLARGLVILARADDAKRAQVRSVMEQAASIIAEIGLRPFARLAKVDPGNLSRVVSGERVPTAAMLAKIETARVRADGREEQFASCRPA